MQNGLPELRRNAGPSQWGGDTSFQLVSISPASSKFAGGATATLKGFNFRKAPDGSTPNITVDGNAASNVVVVDANTITFTIPAATEAGFVDVAVAIGTITETLPRAFTY